MIDATLELRSRSAPGLHEETKGHLAKRGEPSAPHEVGIRLTRPDRLSAVERQAWTRLQDASPLLAGPFFSFELIEAAGQVRRDLEIAVLERGAEIVGFFPFQRGQGGVARPALNRLSEFHGIVGPEDLPLDLPGVLQQCDLKAWPFDHLLAMQTAFHPYHWSRTTSPYMDLSQGYEAYETLRRRAGSALPIEVARKARKCAREAGPLRFELQSNDPAAFASLIRWKTEQQRRTSRFEVMRIPWLVELLDQLKRIETPRFAGWLSSLHAGDRLIAVHFGLATPAALHVWFPAFDRDFARYSPGLILFRAMAQAAAARGIPRIDFGKGVERYKTEFMTGATPIAEGWVDTRVLHRTLRRAWHDTKRWIRASPSRSALALPLEWSRRWRQRRGFGS